MTRARFFVFAPTLLAFVACGDSIAPLPDEGVPDELHFSIGGFAVGSSILDLRGDTVMLRRIPGTGGTVDTLRAVPTADGWRAFWTAAERAGVVRWRERYLAEDIVDGMGWSLRLVVRGRVITSSGGNAYPDALGREHELHMTEEFLAFRAALGELVGAEL